MVEFKEAQEKARGCEPGVTTTRGQAVWVRFARGSTSRGGRAAARRDSSATSAGSAERRTGLLTEADGIAEVVRKLCPELSPRRPKFLSPHHSQDAYNPNLSGTMPGTPLAPRLHAEER